MNGTRFYFDCQNGQYGYNTDPERGADTFSPFSSAYSREYGFNVSVRDNLSKCDSYIPTLHRNVALRFSTLSGASVSYAIYAATSDDNEILIKSGTASSYTEELQCSSYEFLHLFAGGYGVKYIYSYEQ